MAFNSAVLESASRRNVKPTTSTLHMLVEDADCSGFDAAPEDGQFIVALPGAEAATCVTADATPDALSETGSALRMVWSSASRADRQALGDSRVPVIMRGGGRFRTKCFLTDLNTTPSAAGYRPGVALTVALSAATVPHHGSNNRLFLAPVQATGETAAWVVGYVVRVVNNSSVSGTAEIEIMLYSEPRIVDVTAQLQ